MGVILEPGKMYVSTRSGDYVNISGTVTVQSGSYVNIGSGVGVVTSISGQAVFVSGIVDLKSGAYVNIGSGVGVVTSISGQAIFISGTVAINSGSYVNVGSGVGVVLNPAYISGLFIENTASSPIFVASGLFVQGALTASMSGQAVFVSGIVGLLSGSYVNIGSGVGVITSISGQAVFISGIVDLKSGAYVNIGSGVGVVTSISGQAVFVSGTVNVISGTVSIMPPSVIHTRAITRFSDVSGGTTLASGGIQSLSLRSLDGDIYVGGTLGIDMPYSGYGMLVQQGDALTIDIQNFNLVAICASISGYRVSYMGQQ